MFGYRPHDWAQMAGGFIERAAHHKTPLSVIAFNKASGEVDGVMVNEDWLEPPPEAYMALGPEWKPTRGIFRELHTRYNAQSAAPKVEGSAIHTLYFTCVRPAARNLGVMKGLWKSTIEAARDYNFSTILAEAGSEHVRQVLQEHLGFEEMANVDYAEFGKAMKRPEFAELVSANPLEYSRLSLMRRRVPSDLYV